MNVRTYAGHVRRAVARDLPNLIRWGPGAPKWCERIWLDPAVIHSVTSSFDRSWSGLVVGGDWATGVKPVHAMPKVRFALDHWQKGIPWEDTGAFDFVLSHYERTNHPLDGCRTRDEVLARYVRLDELFSRVAHERRIPSMAESPDRAFRESGGIYVHIGPDGPVFGGGGTHRLIIGQLLDIQLVPVQIGVVHPDGLSQLTAARRRPAWERGSA